MEEVVHQLELQDINALYAQIRRDGNFLENIDKKSFVDTPLHAAARTGNTDLVIEITRLKPSFTTKLNPDGFSPLHLALQNGQTETALELIEVDPELVRVKGREGITALHYTSEKGDIYLLVRFLSVCPKSIEDVTNQGDTALHIALKNDKVEAFEVLTRRPPWPSSEESQYCSNRIFNWKDKDGNTLLHIATSKNQLQVVKHLLCCKVDVNARNSGGWTPLDIILNQAEPINEDIKNTLDDAQAVEATSLPITDSDTYRHLLRTDQRLNEAARVGNVDVLYDLIVEDVHILDRLDEVPFIDTPLHIAASAGQVLFALEIMRLKPSFARKQNQCGFSPLHLALQNEQTQMVLRLIDVDRNLIRVQGREGVTSLHYVAGKGIIDLLSEFLVTCPESIQILTNRRETVFHVAAKNDKLEAIEVMLRWLEHVNKDEILNWTDDEGNTLLHIIISRRHCIQMVKLLINRVQINVKNSAGLTAKDILENQTQQLQDRDMLKELNSLLHSASFRQSPLPCITISDFLKKKLSVCQKLSLRFYRKGLLVTNAMNDAKLIVAVLIATATYDAALNSKDVTETLGLSNEITTNSTASGASQQSLGDSRFDIFSLEVFTSCNAIAFSASMVHIYRTLPPGSATLAWPLIVCFLVLSGNSLLFVLIMTTAFLWIAMPLSTWTVQFIYGSFRPGISSFNFSRKVLGHIFKHYRSFHNEMIESGPMRRDSTLFR